MCSYIQSGELGIFGILGESHQTNKIKGQKYQINHQKADYRNTHVPRIKSQNYDEQDMFMDENNINRYPSKQIKFSRHIDRNPLTTNFINKNNNVANLVSYRRKLEKFENDNTEGGGDKEFYADDVAQRKNNNVRRITMHHRHRRASPQNITEDHEKRTILSTTPLPAPSTQPSTKLQTVNAIVDLNQSSSSDKTFYEKSELSDALNAIENQNSNEQIIILSNTEEVDSNSDNLQNGSDLKEVDSFMLSDEPLALPLRPIIRGPYDDEHQGEMSVVYAEPHTEVRLNCEVDLDVATTVWMKDGQSTPQNSKAKERYRRRRQNQKNKASKKQNESDQNALNDNIRHNGTNDENQQNDTNKTLPNSVDANKINVNIAEKGKSVQNESDQNATNDEIDHNATNDEIGHNATNDEIGHNVTNDEIGHNATNDEIGHNATNETLPNVDANKVNVNINEKGGNVQN